MRNLTKRYIIKSLEGLNLSNPIRYERYYINDNLRIQKKNNKYEKEILDKENNLVKKEIILRSYRPMKEIEKQEKGRKNRYI